MSAGCCSSPTCTSSSDSEAGTQLTVVALPFQVYSLTHSAFAVGAIGAVQLMPMLVVAIIGGALADKMDRRRLLFIINLLLMACSVLLAAGAFLGWSSLP